MNPRFKKYTLLFSISSLIVISSLYGIYYLLQFTLDEKEKLKSYTISSQHKTKEKCLVCHSGLKSFEASHNPELIGCTSCHLGNPNVDNKHEAHSNMILTPGNASNAEKTCGRIGCHPQMISRMQNNIMNTMNGVVSVDKWAFDELSTPTAKTPIQLIGYSAAETHLRNLCASCHLSNEKTELGSITELSRGGGCLACHLNYTQEATEYLKKYVSKKPNLNYQFTFHPQINLNVSNMHCFGCHSRSGRISLSYDGWHETILKPDDVRGKIGFRILDDERVVQQIKKDIHSEKGMVCADCHTSYEVMGDGSYALHKEDQMKVQCIDCHLVGIPKTKKISELDNESKKIAELLKLNVDQKNYLVVAKNGFPLVNSFYENGISKIIKKATKGISIAKPPISICIEGKAHKDLSCNACHSSWTPQCIGCHTEYDENSTMFDLLDNKETKGEWLEYGKNYLAEPATLGVKEKRDELGKYKRTIDEFTPGMILTIDKKDGSKQKFKRLFAPIFSHTIRKEARSCENCHKNPLVLGYGRGKLEFVSNKTKGKWYFYPHFPQKKEDYLPEDAWIGFLQESKKNSATREYARPFNLSEQKRILTVGACLNCHNSNSAIMKAAILDFRKIKNLLSSKCVIPTW